MTAKVILFFVFTVCVYVTLFVFLGMGFKEQTEQWTQHDSNFSELLQKLSGSDCNVTVDVNVKSLEEKSQKSRARVHYKKFTRGKDLSRYSAKDLANIFGKRSLKEENKKEEPISVEEEKKSKAFGIETIQGGSMADYFKKKLPGFNPNNGYLVGSNGVLKKESESEDERPCFGMGFADNCEEKLAQQQSFVSYVNRDGSNDDKQMNSGNKKSTFVSYLGEDDLVVKKSKKKKKSSEDIEEIPNKKVKLETLESPSELKLEPQEASSNKKKKKSKKVTVDTDLGVCNSAFDPLFHRISVEKHVLDTIEEDESFVEENESSSAVPQKSSVNMDKLQKKKNRINQDDPVTSEGTENDYSSISQESDVKTKKKQKKKDKISEETREKTSKKQKKQKYQLNGFTNPDFDQESLNNEIQFEGEFNNPYEIKIKKKKRRDFTENAFAVDNPNFDLNCSTEPGICEATVEENKSKKQKKKSVKDAFANSNFDENPKNEETQNNFAVDNPIFDANSSVEANGANGIYEVKRKDKKKKKKQKETEIDESRKRKREEPAATETNDIDCDIMLNVVTESVAPPKQKPSKPEPEAVGTVTPGKIPKRRKSVRFSDVNEERIIPNYTKEHEENLNYVATLLGKQMSCKISNGILNEGFSMETKEKSFTLNGKSNKKHGLDNAAFSEQSANIEENLVGISKTIDNYQAQIENDFNEAKDKSVPVTNSVNDIMVGIVSSKNETHVKTEEGVVLAFTRASFGKSPSWSKKSEYVTTAKKSYKHLIKGDILVGFKNCNLHHVDGYATTIEKQVN